MLLLKCSSSVSKSQLSKHKSPRVPKRLAHPADQMQHSAQLQGQSGVRRLLREKLPLLQKRRQLLKL